LEQRARRAPGDLEARPVPRRPAVAVGRGGDHERAAEVTAHALDLDLHAGLDLRVAPGLAVRLVVRVGEALQGRLGDRVRLARGGGDAVGHRDRPAAQVIRDLGAGDAGLRGGLGRPGVAGDVLLALRVPGADVHALRLLDPAHARAEADQLLL